ncbi:MAG: hypothetical protein KJ915_00160 [Candidatus Omnitrophica bacterium]|nr:hypothetical protein [Candidatus Omnitrophota bacterium]
MQNIPFFPQFVIYFPIFVGIIMFIFSFNKKLYEAWERDFGEKKANRNKKIFRYGAPFMILLGVVQFAIKGL